jgi:protein-disulfide isomerase
MKRAWSFDLILMKPLSQKHINLVIYSFSAILIILIVAKLYDYHTTPSLTKIEKNTITEHENDIIWGTNSAPITVFMYSSYQCKFCKQFFIRVFPEIKENYIDPGHVKLVLKLVDLSENPNMMQALQAAVCVNKYGDFDKLHELLLYNSMVVHTEGFKLLLEDYIATNTDIAQCLINHNDYAYIKNNIDEFKTLKFTGTPTFIINNTIYPGFRSFEKFENIFQKNLSDATK